MKRFFSCFWVLGLGCLFLVTSCNPVLHTRGNFTDPEQVKKVKVGETPKSQVHELLGPPSSQELFTGSGWYYIGEQTTTRAFFNPKILERRIIVIEFDDKDKVASLNTFDHIGYSVSPVSETTPTYGHDPSVLSEIFGNIGRYNDSQKEKKKI